MENTGYLEWAAANDLVVIFPQVKKNDLNPKGCWDFWGYTGVDYASSLAVQTQAIHRMVTRVMETPATLSVFDSLYQMLFGVLSHFLTGMLGAL